MPSNHRFSKLDNLDFLQCNNNPVPSYQNFSFLKKTLHQASFPKKLIPREFRLWPKKYIPHIRPVIVWWIRLRMGSEPLLETDPESFVPDLNSASNCLTSGSKRNFFLALLNFLLIKVKLKEKCLTLIYIHDRTQLQIFRI